MSTAICKLLLRIYKEVFAVEGGIEAVRALADRNLDPVADTLYGRLEHYVGRLSANSDEDEFLAAVVVYRLIAEGVIARTAQNLAAGQYERLAFPGLAEGQRLVARDEARHIGIGVTYTRRRLERDPERASQVIGGVIDDFAQLATAMLATASNDMATLVRTGYGVEPKSFHAEAMRLLQLRLRSIGYLTPVGRLEDAHVWCRSSNRRRHLRARIASFRLRADGGGSVKRRPARTLLDQRCWR